MMFKRLKAFACEVLTSGQSHREIKKRAENVYRYFRHVKSGYSSFVSVLCLLFYVPIFLELSWK